MGAVNGRSSGVWQLAPPVLRLIMEISTWIWLFIFSWILMLADVLMLAIFNAPGDKDSVDQPVRGIEVPPPIRFIIEMVTAGLGVYCSYLVRGGFSDVLVMSQFGVVVGYVLADLQRLLWLLGVSEAPAYIHRLHEYKR